MLMFVITLVVEVTWRSCAGLGARAVLGMEESPVLQLRMVTSRCSSAQDPPCPWYSENVCFLAALHGHLEVLRWARSQGCPWNKSLTWTAAMSGQLKVLVWLIKEECPYNKRQCREAAARGGERARKVLEWLDE